MMLHNVHPFLTKITAGVTALIAIPALSGCSPEVAPEDTSVRPSATTAETTLRPSDDATRMGGTIIFAASERIGGAHDMYIKDLDTGVVTNLTNSPSDELNPQVSPDGTAAVYAGENSKGDYQIFRINLASRKIIQLTNHDANDFDPTFTPDGDILYKSNQDDGYGDIWIMNGDGKSQRNLTPGMSTTEEWKPTAVGDRVVFTSRHADDGSMNRQQLAATDELMLLDMTKKTDPKYLTSNDYPDWYSEADPARPGVIAYTSKATIGGSDTIFEMDITQPNPEQKRVQLTDSHVLPGDSSDGSWASNGTLLFANNNNGRYAAMALAGGKIYPLHSAGGDVLSPVAVSSIEIG